MAKENILVRFHGLDLMWLKNDNGDGPLAPLHHLDPEGHVNLEDAFFSDSYAHVKNGGQIWRYGNMIGSVDDLEFVPVPRVN